MEILTTYNNDTLQLITDSENYILQNFWEYYVNRHFDLRWYYNYYLQGPITADGEATYGTGTEEWRTITSKADFGQTHYNKYSHTNNHTYPIIKLSVFSEGGSFLTSGRLENEQPPYNRIFSDFYIKNNQIFLKPNEFLDREGFSEGNYNLQFDFIQRFKETDIFYISEISPSRKEIRIEVNEKIYEDAFDNNLKNHILYFLKQGDIIDANEIFTDFANYSTGAYNFNSFLELSQGRLIPINGYAFDNITNNKRTLILKLNQPLPNNISTLSKDFRIVNKFLSSQSETIFFIDREKLAISGLGLDIDEGYSTEDTTIIDDYLNYNAITGSSGTNIINELQRQKKDINLNIDYSKFSNHAFFGSAESRLKNFKTKAVKLEGLYGQISSSLSNASTANVIEKRKDLFNQVEGIKNNFTHYENFLYMDGQSYSSASAPGIGSNLAGTDFSNKYSTENPLTSTINSEGFDTVYMKSSSADYLHLFTDVYNAENPPFYNTNKAVYLSFIMRGFTGSAASPGSNFNLDQNGGHANINYDSITTQNYEYGRRRIPFEAYSGSAMMNPTATGSNYQRYIFKGEQTYWRPTMDYGSGNIFDPGGDEVMGDIGFMTLYGDDFAPLWSGSDYTSPGGLYNYYQTLTGSAVIDASTSGGTGDGYAYGIKDPSGQYRPYFFPSGIEATSGSNIEGFVTASIMPQGDLFPISMNSPSSSNAYFTDVKVSYNNPTDIHPFSNIYRPPSGSYDGSTTWNTWYDALLTTAQNYDNDNIHSLINNLPFSLRTDEEHQTLRDFVNMLGEQFDLLRSYIDNYQNFYKMGYKNPNSIPDNLLPIIGDSIGFDLMNPYSGSITNYLESNEVEGIGIKGAINSLWKKILNNVIYVYKSKGTQASLSSLLNLYGFDSNSFKLSEYGGSIEEHNPTVVDNTANDLLDGLKNKRGNISFISEVTPFPMLNLTSGSNYLALDWWTNDANPNGIEFLFHADKSTTTQTLLRSSGSNDYWDLRVVPSGSSNTKGKLEFRLNYKENVSSAIGTNHISMSTDYISNIMSDNIFNVMVQRNVVTASNALADCAFTQSYHMFVARKDDDKIRNVQFISMSSHDAVSLSGSNINQNFITSSALTGKNLFMGETISGSVAEIRTWDSYVSMSKFKQHVLNYHSVVGGSVTSGVDDVIYRFRLNENIPNYNRHPNSASLKIHDSNPQHTKDYSHLISTQPSLNFRACLHELTFYKFGVRGTDEIKNDNQTNIGAKLYTQGSLSPNAKTLVLPKVDGKSVRQNSNKIGKTLSYVNSIDSMVINLMSDFKLDDYLEDGTMDGVYSDLIDLRKKLISNNIIKVDIAQNLKSAERLFNNSIIKNLKDVIPAKSKLDISYEIKNDILFRSKIKNAILQTQLNPNLIVGSIGSATFAPDVVSNANQNYKTATLDIIDDELTTSGFANQNVKNGTVDILSNELTITSTANQNVKTNHSTPLDIIDLSNSKTESIYTMTPDITSIFLGSKNEFYKNHGKGDNQVYFKSSNVGNNGDYNTYKYETRFTFPTIGDTEEFHPVSGTLESRTGTNARQPYNHHDNFRHFHNRQFIDSGSYTYTSFFADNAEPGRMIGRTRFFRTDTDGNITYPSNHFIHARTSKDVLDNLIYKGTQNDGSRPTTDPMDLDPQRTIPAYVINVGGSDTLKKLKVIR